MVRRTCAFVALMVVVPFAVVAQQRQKTREDEVRDALVKEVGADLEPSAEQNLPTQYAVAFIDLNADGQDEAVVYVQGRELCGSGGCRLFVLRADGNSYKVMSETTLVRPPIFVLPTRTRGWNDLAVWVRGGGERPHQAVLPFDGKGYADNPTVAPAHRARKAVDGKPVLSETSEFKKLFR
jgi:hypothetical protein